MNQSSFSFAGPRAWAAPLGSVPPGLLAELHNRIVLWLNHVLQQEPQAMERLRRHQGKVLRIQWASMHLSLQATPAGLLALGAADQTPDLRLQLQETSPVALAKTMLAGSKPGLDIQGDVQLAAEVAWLGDHLRWDAEEDLARILGDTTAHRLAEGAAMLLAGLKTFASYTGARGKT